MAQEDTDCLQKFIEQEKSQRQLQTIDRAEEIIKVEKLVEKPKASQDTVTKAKRKYALRANTQKRRIKSNTTRHKSNQAMIPIVPQKVLQILQILRHESFLKVVSKFFHPRPTVILYKKLTTSSTQPLNDKINTINNKSNIK